jgi:acetoacetyl-CoA synthetase
LGASTILIHSMQLDALPQEPGELLCTPSPQQIQASRLHDYQGWLARHCGIPASSYDALRQWSTRDLEAFWQSIWDYGEVVGEGERQPALANRQMPGARWFPHTRLNYAENVFRYATADRPAIIARTEHAPLREMSWSQLERDTAPLSAQLRAWDIGPGDRVASYLPNWPETVTAFLACASIGAIWSSCAPDMGPTVVLERLRQIEPKLLLVTDSYSYNGKLHDRTSQVSQLLAQLPSVQRIVHVHGPMQQQRLAAWPDGTNCVTWADAIAQPAPARYQRVAFDHPLWIVYSSGTTGLPKAMVHGHGGIVLMHKKTMMLQHDMRVGDRLLFLASTGWIVWNLQVGALLTGASIVLYDGNPAWPDPAVLWRFLDEQGVTLFGCGAAYLINCMKEGLRPRQIAPLARLRAINVTGSPLPAEAFRWVYAQVKRDVWLASISGGTDIATGIVACAPTEQVRAGEIQCPELGVAAYAYDDAGQPVIDQVGELVVTQPMPSMPLYFWNDPGNQRYLESYFDMYPGVWRHGDWIRFTPRRSAVIYGRSDSTINRFGIRMGTAEIYRVVEQLPEVRDSLVVDLEYLGRESFMPLFVVLRPGVALSPALAEKIKSRIRAKASARHVPDTVIQIQDVPRTLTGKKWRCRSASCYWAPTCTRSLPRRPCRTRKACNSSWITRNAWRSIQDEISLSPLHLHINLIGLDHAQFHAGFFLN